MLKALWQLPQILLGLVLIKVFQARKDETGIWLTRNPIGISLGPIIIIYINASPQTILHEQGHSRQSLYLGPLYLILVGLPSITMNILSLLSTRFFSGKFASRYYKRWPESWADNISGIVR
jgi:hypothetical protein